MRAAVLPTLFVAACSGAANTPPNLPDPTDAGTRDAGFARDGGGYADPCDCGPLLVCEAGGCVAKDVVLVQFIEVTEAAVSPIVGTTMLRAVSSTRTDDRPILAEGAGCIVYGDGDGESTHESECLDHGDLEIEADGVIRPVAYSCSDQQPVIIVAGDAVDHDGRIDVRAAGGADVGAFETFGFIPGPLTVDAPSAIVPGEPFTVTWSTGGPSHRVELEVGRESVYARCEVPDTGSLEIPANVTARLLPGEPNVFLNRYLTTDKQVIGDVVVTTVQRQTFNQLL